MHPASNAFSGVNVVLGSGFFASLSPGMTRRAAASLAFGRKSIPSSLPNFLRRNHYI